MAAPEDHVVADHAGDQVDDLRIARQFKERRLPRTPSPLSPCVRRDQLLGSHARVVAHQAVERLAPSRHSRRSAGGSAGPPSPRRGTVRSPRQAPWPGRKAARAAKRRAQPPADPGDDLRRLGRAGLALDLAAAPHQQQGRDAADREARRGPRAGVAVDLGEQRLALSCAAACANCGAIAWHGPHQSAQKSTTTGSSVLATTLSKLASSSATGAAPSSSCCSGRRSARPQARIGDAVGREAVRADDQHGLLPGNSGSRPGRRVAGPLSQSGYIRSNGSSSLTPPGVCHETCASVSPPPWKLRILIG